MANENNMANASVTRIQFKNDSIFESLNRSEKQKVINLGYNNNDDAIVISYILLLSVGSNWKKIKDLAASIKKEKSKLIKNNEKIDSLRSDFYNLAGIYYNEFEYEITNTIQDYRI